MSSVVVSSESIEQFAALSGDLNPLHTNFSYARATPFGRPVAHGALAVLYCLAQLPERDGQLSRLEVSFYEPVFPETAYSLEITDGAGSEPELVLRDGQRRVLAATCEFRFGGMPCDARPTAEGTTVGRRSISRDLEPTDIVKGMTQAGVYGCVPEDVSALMSALGLHGRGVSNFHVQALAWCSYGVGMEVPGTSALLSRIAVDLSAEAPGEAGVADGFWEVEEHHLERGVVDLHGQLGDTSCGRVWAEVEARAWVRPRLPEPDVELTTELVGESTLLGDKVAVVIGGSRGLGAALVLGLVLQGATVYLVHKSSPAAVARLLGGLGSRSTQVQVIEGDCADPRFCSVVGTRIANDHGRIDILVLNAAPALRAQDPDVEAGQRLVSYVDLALSMVTSPLAALGQMVDRAAGAVVWVSSSAVTEPVEGWSHYVTAKAAVEGLARSVRTRYPHTRSLVVRPPRLLTTLTSSALGAEAVPPERVAAKVVRWFCSTERAEDGIAVMEDFSGSAGVPDPEPAEGGHTDVSRQSTPAIQIVATFTADPVLPVLRWWMDKLGLDLEPRLSPYAQVLQELLLPTSDMSRNAGGVNVVLLRPSDWPEKSRTSLVKDLGDAVRGAVARSDVPHLVLVCPSPPGTDGVEPETDRRVLEQLGTQLEGIAGAYVFTTNHFGPQYVGREHHDHSRDRLGHLPYTREGFAGLATMIARSIRALRRSPAKVLVLDADNTLWGGVCSEDGIDGVRVDEEHLELQRWALELRARGVLLCLASKNLEQDVHAVMERQDMLLSPHDFAAERVNWLSKSSNIRDMVAELDLSLDTVVFLDDNPSEVSEVTARLPQVLGLRLASGSVGVRGIIDHTWAFDQVEITSEDRWRADRYQEARVRKEFQESSLDFASFLAGLRLRIDMHEAAEADRARASQMTYRTTQFNTTGLRLSVSEIARLGDRGASCWVASVTDRFGDHGTTCLAITSTCQDRFLVENFLMSCRMLGKGIEHAVLARLGKLALEAGLGVVEIPVIPTERNQPVRDFLQNVAGRPEQATGPDGSPVLVHRLASTNAAAVEFQPQADTVATAAPAEPTPTSTTRPSDRFLGLSDILSDLTTSNAVADTVDGKQNRLFGDRPLRADRDCTRQVIAAFSKVLRHPMDELGPSTRLADLGLNSMLLVELTVELERSNGRLPSTLLYESETLADVAQAVSVAPPEGAAQTPVVEVGTGPNLDHILQTPPVESATSARAVAVVGLAGRYPGARNLAELWGVLSSGRSQVREMPEERQNSAFREAATGAADVNGWRGCFLDDVMAFDSLYFNISPLEASAMDPQQRLFLETATEALHDAGYTSAALGHRVGVYVGAMASDYNVFSSQATLQGGPALPHSALYQIANRVSYVHDFHGPSVTVDTACSSSGVALHRAYRDVRSGEVDAAIAGGVNLLLHPARFIQYTHMNMLSPSGVCRPFGAGADGMVMGEGVGAVLLKPLDAAERDGDHIYALIRGSAVNTAGHTQGFTVPSPVRQAELVQAALEDAQLSAERVSMVEAHGTGTPLGDPIEIRGLSQALAARAAAGRPCFVSSIKSVIGHLEPASAIAGLTKAILELRHRIILPSLGAETLNPKIDFESTPFFVPTSCRPWPEEEVPRIVGVSSFGAGGVNAHLLLEEYQAPVQAPLETGEEQLLLLSARTEELLATNGQILRDHLCGEGADQVLSHVAHTLRVGRPAMQQRLALVVADRESAIKALDEFVERGPAGIVSATCRHGLRPGGGHSEGLSHVLGTSIGVDFLTQLGRAGDLTSLATLWVQGVDVDWQQVLPGYGAQRVSLPAAPFARPVHSLLPTSAPVVLDPKIVAHDPAAPRPSDEMVPPEDAAAHNQGDEVGFDGSEPWLRDHVISGRLLIPAVVYLDLVLRSFITAQPSLPRGPRAIRNVVWSSPLVLSGDELRIRILNESQGPEGTPFAMVLQEAQPGAPVAMRASVSGVGERPEGERAVRNQEHASTAWTKEEIYRNLAERGMDYGPALQSVIRVERITDGARSTVVVPATIAAEEEDGHILHPAVMDGALQTALVGSGLTGVFLPYSLAECWVSDKGTCQEATVCVNYRRRDPRMLRCDLDVVAPDGRLLVALRDLVLLPERSVPEKQVQIGAMRPVWRPALDEHSGGTAQQPTHVVVLSDEESDLETWRLEQTSCDWVLAELTELDALLDDESASVLLVDYRGLRGRSVSVLQRLEQVHEIATAVLRGRGIATHLVVTLPAVEDPAAVAASAFSLAASHESAALRSVRVEVANLDDMPGPHDLLEEWRHSDAEVRARHTDRQVRSFEPVELPPLSASLLPRRGHYVITGGGGGIGQKLGIWLASRHGARVLLVGRSPSGPWEGRVPHTTDGEVHYAACDVTDRQALAAALAEERKNHGPFTGVVHAAGVIDDAPLLQKPLERCARVLGPKTTGATLLDELTAEDPLEFFALMSSTAGTLGSAGQSDYSMANRFLDALAEQRSQRADRGQRRGRTVSLVWPLWSDGGMQLDPAMDLALQKSTGFAPVSSEEAFLFFERALGTDEPVLIAALGDLPRIQRTLQRHPLPRPTRARDVRPATVEATLGPNRLALVAVLRELAIDLLHISEQDLDGDVEFSDVGFDSVLYAEYAAKINERTGTDISPVVFFDHATLDLLADHLLAEHEPHLSGRPAVSEQTTAEVETQQEPEVPAANGAVALAAGTIHPQQVEASTPRRQKSDGIAVIGMAGRFPGADDLETFWQNLLDGVDAVSEVPADRWDWHAHAPSYPGEPSGIRSRWGGFLSDVERFDNELFHLSERETVLMDPQQRLFLETAWSALEDSGRNPRSLRGTSTGVFVGVTLSDHLQRLQESGVPPVGHLATGNVHSIVANRVSFALDLRGPSEVVDTACSSSLVALHRAVSALHAGECNLAVVGGVNTLLTPFWFAAFDHAGMLSARGRCATFDAAADGYVRGEGVGAVVLRRLDEAVDDGDTIHGVISGSAVGHGGHAHSLTAPSPAAQATVIAAAHRRAGGQIPVSHIEAHGTGTPLGDPIEVEGLRLAGVGTGDSALNSALLVHLGALKPAIGHLESASGIAGLIKVLLAMRHRWLPGNLHFETPNPHLGLDTTALRVLEKGCPWEPVDHDGAPVALRAGLSAFGFGGVNAHIVVDEPPQPPKRDYENIGPCVAVLSASDRAGLMRYARAMGAALAEQQDRVAAVDAAWTLSAGRPSLDHRVAVVADTVQEMARGFLDFADGVDSPEVFSGQVPVGQESVAEGPPASGPLSGRSAAELQARRWVSGGLLPELPSRATPPRRVSLPTHPFACWRHPITKILPRDIPDDATPTTDRLVLLRPGWGPANVSPATEPSPAPRTVVLLVGQDRTIDLAAALPAAPGARWVLLREDSGLPRITRDEYVFTDDDEAAIVLERLLADHEIDAVVDLTGLDSDRTSVVAGRDFGDHLLELVRRRLQPSPASNLGILMVGCRTWMRPVQARRAAVVRALGVEYRSVSAACLDLQDPPDDIALLLNLVLDELKHLDRRHPRWTLLGTGERLDRSLEELPLPTTALAQGKFGPFAIDSTGTYVITGGTSGLGLAIARRLVERGARHLALLGRRPMPSAHLWDDLDPNHPRTESVEVLRELRALGAHVMVHSGELDDREPLDRFLSDCISQGSRIAGVVHCAGDVPRAVTPFAHQSIDDVRRAWRGKDAGWDVLAICLEDQWPDFVVLFSSVSSILPALGAGWAAYAGANAYLDAEANRRSTEGGSPVVRSISWGSWNEGGTGVITTPAHQRTGLRGLGLAEGLDLLEHALMVQEPHLVAVKMQAEGQLLSNQQWSSELGKSVRQGMAVEAGQPDGRGQDGEYMGSKNTEDFLLDLFEEHLGVSRQQLQSGVSFGLLGVDSIFIAGLVPLLETYLGRPVQPTVVLEHDTVRGLASALGPREETAGPPSPRTFQGTTGPMRHGDDIFTRSRQIAVIGMAGRYPGAPDLGAFWDLLSSGKCAVGEVPQERWDVDALYRSSWAPGAVTSRWGGFLEDVDHFDPEYFGIDPATAADMHPATRLFLETSDATLRSAGYERSELEGRCVGVYVGGGIEGYGNQRPDPGPDSATGLNQNFLAAQVAQWLNLRGPHLVVDTACSSSLVALHLGLQALHTGDCDLCLVGGVDLLLDKMPYLKLSAAKALSSDGLCHTFDAKANGLVLGEGVGAVLLKPFEMALQEGDRILAVIEGTAMNNDGRTMGLTTPSPKAQREVVERALGVAEADPASVTYVEAHGTGTLIGDPIEVQALSSVFDARHGSGPWCGIGSVKTNIGHLLRAAGMASLHKVLLALAHAQLPPTLHCDEPNPRFDFAHSVFEPVTSLVPWPERDGLRRAGVSSFGFGGTNVHVVLRGPRPEELRAVRRAELPPAPFRRRRFWLPEMMVHTETGSPTQQRKPLLALQEED
ncbi:MAG: SDR family NAD(P)-dependent oxidoreductase [Propionibacteriaceae bacterium]|nr:SDR family NAD(P)-dependent oxidoreductase [Propionibacteriaceae bacterium]